jgi:hypothetical protein
VIFIIIITITSAFSSSLVMVTVFPQRGIVQGEHVCAVMFNASIVSFDISIIYVNNTMNTFRGIIIYLLVEYWRHMFNMLW